MTSGTTAAVSLLLGNGDGTFASAVALPALPFTPSAVFTADLNHDSHLDLVATQTSGTTVAVLLGTGTGSFGAATSFTAGSAPSFATLDDFNGDTHLDIAVPNLGGTTVSVLFGDGLGSFGAPVPTTLPGTVQRARQIGDVNGDNKPDLGVAVSVGGAPNGLYLLINNGAGGFLTPVQVLANVGVTAVSGADLNKDGKRDLVAVTSQETLYVLHGDGLGGFGPPTPYIAQEMKQGHIEIVDLNGDGRPDLVGPASGNSIYVLLNTCASSEVADIEVSLTGPTTGAAGDVATYTATVTNHGPAVATGVVFMPTGSEGFDFISSSCVISNTLSCTAASLPVGDSVSFTFTLRLFGGTQFLLGSVTSLQADPDTSNNSGTLAVEVTSGPLSFVVTNTLDDFDIGSLRHAIENSNNNPGATNTISFNIPGPGPFTFTPQSPLEAITTPVVIDGWTQGVFMGTPGYSGPPLIELNGAFVPGNQSGLFISAGGTTVRGLAINGFLNSVGIFVQGNGGNVIQGNYIGTNLAGTAAKPNTNGIIVNAPNTIVGGTTVADRNVISGNTQNGVSVGAAASGAVVSSTGQGSIVLGNYIGLNAAGTAAIPNNNGVNVSVPDVTVGTPAAGNVISGNTQAGVTANSGTVFNTATIISTPTGLLIQNNRIGTNVAGTAELHNNAGINIGAGNARVGGTQANTGNVISGNASNGINLTFQSFGPTGSQVFVGRADGVVVEGNTIGPFVGGTVGLSNTTGVRVGAPNAIIGGTAPGAGNVISGTTTGPGVTVVRGLMNGITLVSDGTGAQILGNYIGTDSAGSATMGNGTNGVAITDVSSVTVGSVGAGRNVIARNTNGISISGSNVPVSGIRIAGNHIGVAPNGTTALGNTSNGVNLSISAGTISGTVVDQNVISANVNGISNNRGGSMTITGNRIGTNAAGAVAMANTNQGILLTGVSGSTIGGTTAVARNILSGNGGYGVSIGTTAGFGSVGNVILGNYIGTDANGTTAIPNGLSGINLGISGPATDGTIIGGAAAGAGNVISGNNQGLLINNGVLNTTIAGNIIGLNAAGTQILANSGIGIAWAGSSGTIGGTGAGEGNVISGNGTATTTGHGINLNGGSALIVGNRIGTNAAGDTAMPNSDAGIFINNSSGYTIGGTSASARNIISGNGAFGKFATGLVMEGTSTGNLVQGNYIGLAADGSTGLGNATTRGISIGGGVSGNTIGGSVAGAGNVISGNGSVSNSGVGIFLAGNNTIVAGNLIGTNAAGTAAVGNAAHGIDISGTGNTIGGTTALARNVISGNGFGLATVANGISLQSAATTNQILGNYIGVNAAGTAAVPNNALGVYVLGNSNTIGSEVAGAGNVISGNGIAPNAGYGVTLQGPNNSNTVKGNQIGTDATGTGAIGNLNGGVFITGSSLNNIIGSTVAGGGNTVAFNGGVGIMVGGGTGNAIRGNAVFSNAGIGIDLGNNGQTANDLGDGDAGANNLLNFPTINTVNTGSTNVDGTYNGPASTLIALDFFAGSVCDAGGFGEGQRYLGSTTFTTDGSGNASFGVTLAAASVAGEVVTATATDPSGNTSEFSACVTVTSNLPVVTITPTDANAAEAGLDPGTFTVTRTGATTSALTVNVTVGGTATTVSDYTAIGTSVIIPATQASTTVTVTPVEDGASEQAETVTVTIAPAAAYVAGSPSAATVTIADNDTQLVTVDAVDPNAAEPGLDPGTFRFTRTGLITSSLAITYTVTGSAGAGADYSSISTTVSFPANQATVDRVVTPINDATVEAGGETVIVTLVDGAAYDLGAQTQATVTIADQPVPIITVTTLDADASEVGLDPGTFRFTRVGDTQFGLAITYTVTGTAAAGGDYSSISTTVSFPAGQTTVDRTVTPINDATVEAGGETVIVTLTDGAEYDLGATTTGTVTIADQPVPIITISVPDGSASEVGLDPGTFTFTRVGNTQFGLAITYTVTGTATGGGDYGSISTTVSFPAGQTTVNRTVTPINDATVEAGGETVIVTLTDGAQYDLGATTIGTVTIADQPVPIITMSVPDGSASEVGLDPGTFRFSRVGNTEFALAITYTVTGTAAGGGDYGSISTTVSFPANQTTVDKVITPINDAVVEGSETVIVTLTDGAQYDLGATTTGTVTIADQPVPIITISVPDGSASEVGLDPGTFRFTRVGNTQFALAITYTVTGTASGGGDYGSISTTVTFPAGQTTVDRTVTPINDGVVEAGGETVIVTLTDGAQYDLGVTTTGTVTIADQPVPIVTIATQDAAASELGLDPGTFRFTRVGDTQFALLITYTVTGTASGGSDYNSISSNVAFVAGQATVDRTVTPIDDPTVEGDETVIVTLVDGAEYNLGVSTTATVTIADDDVSQLSAPVGGPAGKASAPAAKAKGKKPGG